MSIREKVYGKYSGKCAYCGNDVEYKDFQVDHLCPKSRSHWYKSQHMIEANNLRGDNVDSFENLMPSCRRCNHYKRTYSLEDFRNLIKTLHERISTQYINKVGLDYGVITVKPFDGIFYFEKGEAVETTCNI